MPRTKSEGSSRVGIRLPRSMVDEIDRIVEKYPGYHWSRQQFVEQAIRDFIFKFKSIHQDK